MNSSPPTTSTCLKQTYLVEPEVGLLCRILGLYAARGVDVRRVAYEPAEPDAMTLLVCVANEQAGMAETARVLKDKAASLVGVIAVE